MTILTPLVYVETSVWSFAFAADSPELRQLTLDFFKACRGGKFTTMVGPAVYREILRADQSTRQRLLDLVSDVNPAVLTVDLRAEQLAGEFLRLGAVPPSKPDDAAHVAYAFQAQADILVSWNFKHIASLRRSERFNAAALLRGYHKRLIITTPAEILYGDDPTDFPRLTR